MFALLAIFVFFLSSFFSVNAPTTKTVNFCEWFESFESFISIISLSLNLWIWMSRHMNQTYFECSKFNVDSLQPVFINQCWTEYDRIKPFNTVDSLILKISWVLMSSEKAISEDVSNFVCLGLSFGQLNVVVEHVMASIYSILFSILHSNHRIGFFNVLANANTLRRHPNKGDLRKVHRGISDKSGQICTSIWYWKGTLFDLGALKFPVLPCQ